MAEKEAVEEKTEAAEEKPAKKETKKSSKSAGSATAKLDTEQLIEQVKGMTVLELSELVKALEDEFGVSAAAPVAVAGPAGGAGGGAEEAGEEKTAFDVVLTGAGDKKIQVIKVVRSATGLGLKEAKALVDEAPKPIKEGVSKDEADKVKAELEEAGGTVEIK